MNLPEQFQQIKTLVFDMDGVLTDGSLLIMPGHKFIRTMDIKDGYALQHAVKKGYHVVVISGSMSKACAERLEYLGIRNVFMKVKDKEEALAQFILSNNLKWSEVLFMGDDIPDLEVMKMTGLPCCPADAVSEIKAVSKFISTKKGGKGCVREVIEKVLKLNDDWVNVSTDIAAI
ncbi:MAG: HAD hydrolase family protein [Chitinophagaceae bacterium]|nr:HAD hydrolase family protein [Chitinophagaceae bacterium]